MKPKFLFASLLMYALVPGNAGHFMAEASPSLTSPVQSSNGMAQATIDELSNIENLLGYWFVPHAATLNIRFYRDKTFIFNDYNSILDKTEKLQGTYQLTKGTLTLLYNDRPKQTFTFFKGAKGDSNYYIKKAGYYFVKGENGDGDE